MFQALRERREDDRGFTLIELMIVVLIIGILIAIGLPSFLGARTRAQDRAAQSVLRNAVVAAKTWYTDNSTFVDFNTAATASQKGCAATLPSVPAAFSATTPPAAVLYASCVEPSIPWTTGTLTTSTSLVTMVQIKVSTASELCLITVSANGPTLWYASDTGAGTTIATAGASIPSTCDGA